MDLIEVGMRSIAARSAVEIREAIFGLQEHLLTLEGSTDLSYFPVQHHFAPGSYAREMTLPEGSVIIGKIHRHAHVNVISAGRVRVLTEFGMEELSAPCTFVSQPGTKRVVHALENTVWTTIHVTNSTDLAEIEKEIIAEQYSDIEVEATFRREL